MIMMKSDFSANFSSHKRVHISMINWLRWIFSAVLLWSHFCFFVLLARPIVNGFIGFCKLLILEKCNFSEMIENNNKLLLHWLTLKYRFYFLRLHFYSPNRLSKNIFLTFDLRKCVLSTLENGAKITKFHFQELLILWGLKVTSLSQLVLMLFSELPQTSLLYQFSLLVQQTTFSLQFSIFAPCHRNNYFYILRPSICNKNITYNFNKWFRFHSLVMSISIKEHSVIEAIFSNCIVRWYNGALATIITVHSWSLTLTPCLWSITLLRQ